MNTIQIYDVDIPSKAVGLRVQSNISRAWYYILEMKQGPIYVLQTIPDEEHQEIVEVPQDRLLLYFQKI